MSSISILGLGTYARAIGTLGVKVGNTVEVIGRDAAKAADLARELGGATAGTFGTAPAGDIVILAVPYASAVPVVAQYGDALAGKVIIDISNTFTAADATELVTPDGSSGAQEIAKAVPASAHVVKAFNTVFAHVLALGPPLDVFFAGDDARAKASVSAFIESLGLRPLDAGGLEVARWLEGAGLVMISLARHGVGNFNFSLGVDLTG
jgi:predicted dinucleotide-binding enzyme